MYFLSPNSACCTVRQKIKRYLSDKQHHAYLQNLIWRVSGNSIQLWRYSTENAGTVQLPQRGFSGVRTTSIWICEGHLLVSSHPKAAQFIHTRAAVTKAQEVQATGGILKPRLLMHTKMLVRMYPLLSWLSSTGLITAHPDMRQRQTYGQEQRL